VVDWDDLWVDSPSYHGGSRLVKAYLRWVEPLAPRLASGVTAASHFLEQEAKRIGCRLIHRIPNGVWKEQFDLCPRGDARRVLGIPEDALVALAFGNTYMQGRGGMLLECMTRLLQERSDAVALFNLDPSVVWRDERPGQPSPSFDGIRFVGQIPQKELGTYLGAADFAVFLSFNRLSEQATYPTRIGSYLNGECPIATNLNPTEVCHVVQEYGCGVVGSSPTEVAKLMWETFRDAQKMSTMRDGARRAKAVLDYDALMDGLVSFYETVTAVARR
jgi:glycosyltransferase involved in cell wall biosynthesis